MQRALTPLCRHRRCLSTASLRSILSEAECRLQCPPAHPFVRNLLSQDLGGLAVSLRSLAGTKHPLVEEAKKSLLLSTVGSGATNGCAAAAASAATIGQTRRTVVLLVARAHEASLTRGTDLHDIELLRRRQCQLADISDSVYTALSIHSRVIQPTDADLAKGNALATLAGDYLLASASLGLAELDRPPVVQLIAEAICDIVAGRFNPINTSNSEASHAKSSSMPSLSSWLDYVRLTSASLLSKSIRSALLIAAANDRHCLEDQSGLVETLDRFSASLAVLHQAYKESLDSSALPWTLRSILNSDENVNTDSFLGDHAQACFSAVDTWPSDNAFCAKFLKQIVQALQDGSKQ